MRLRGFLRVVTEINFISKELAGKFLDDLLSCGSWALKISNARQILLKTPFAFEDFVSLRGFCTVQAHFPRDALTYPSWVFLSQESRCIARAGLGLTTPGLTRFSKKRLRSVYSSAIQDALSPQRAVVVDATEKGPGDVGRLLYAACC
jgi:hypothetical protein